MTFDIHKKYQVYNSLFLDLGYQNSNAVGYLIPILGKVAEKKLNEGINPIEIFDGFYNDYKDIIGEDKIDFMFKVIQYVERQVVLYDSVEDSVSAFQLEDKASVQIADLIAKTKNQTELEDLLGILNEFNLRIVLTAHPTQFYRPQVLDIISQLRSQISQNNIEAIDSLLHQLGLTSLVNTQSPTPLDEALNILHMCRYEYYDAIGKFCAQLKKQHPTFNNYKLIQLGFWPCGDRDGNPFVTHEVTSAVIDALRMTLMKCYYKDLKEIKSKLTFKLIEPLLAGIQDKVYEAMFKPSTRINHLEMISNLEEAKSILLKNYEGLYLNELDELIAKVNVFKSHFASLDIRQDHGVHYNCIQQLLINNGRINESLNELDESALIHLLTEEYINISNTSKLDDTQLDVLLNIKQLASIQEKNGEDGCHRYIISNSEDIFSVLFVYGLFRWTYKSEEFKFDIIPLFESMIGMANSESIMDKLYSLPKYRQHVKNRNENQTMMLGFSDGTKDGGYMKANWSIYKTKEVLATVSKKHKINPIFFDGRGGPPARGGGKTHSFYAARSANVANEHIQLTIQGQTITSTYGTDEKFLYNSEQIITSGIVSLQNQNKGMLNTADQDLLESISELSYQKYNELKNHPRFLPYLEEMTTLKYYSKAKIGSRPGKRNKTAKLTLADLRAISYVGSWSQLKQNIPGYFGVGTALLTLKNQNRLEDLQSLYKHSQVFQTLVDNCMMSLTKCFFELTSYIKADAVYSEFWEMLYQEYLLSKEMTLEITGLKSLMQNEPTTRKSIKSRDEIVMPLLLIQHYALQTLNLKRDEPNKDAYEKLVIRSLYGNINASRNSA